MVGVSVRVVRGGLCKKARVRRQLLYVMLSGNGDETRMIRTKTRWMRMTKWMAGRGILNLEYRVSGRVNLGVKTRTVCQ